jgi:hypothetical protein
MLRAKRRWFLVAGGLGVGALLSWVARGPGSTPSESSSTSTETSRPPAKKAARPPPDVSTLYEEGTSAYHARLFGDDDRVVLVTQAGFTTFLAGKSPAQHAVSLGPVAARQGDALVFWRSGRLRAVSLSGEGERELAALPAPPQYLLASEDRLAWIQTARTSGASLETLSGGDVRVVYQSDDSIAAAVLSASIVYWVAARRDGSWNIGRVDLDGQHTSTGAHQGRPPSMLALGHDGVYFYAGRDRGVRKLSFDLQQETAVLAKVICSPLVVSSRVVCAHVGGLFDIPRAGVAPRFLAPERAGPVTTMAATNDRLFWVAESGDQRLIVRTMLLPEL